MGKFTIEGFAAGCKQAMAAAGASAGAGAADRQRAARAFLETTMAENDPAEIIAVLDAAIPEGADIGEMIVHASPELTMLYARVPPRFQSGIHNHTVFACIGQLAGSEIGVAYERTPEGGLRAKKSVSIKAGEVASLPADAIHHIENPNQTTGSALHIYGGDFGALMDQRSLWTTDGHAEMKFNFQALLGESIKAMKASGNQAGLDALVEAIPAVRALV
jgi:predicted metal-dependent enzyme (double-stranded beta helix superfamily)